MISVVFGFLSYVMHLETLELHTMQLHLMLLQMHLYLFLSLVFLLILESERIEKPGSSSFGSWTGFYLPT
jgi:hypothetical protein